MKCPQVAGFDPPDDMIASASLGPGHLWKQMRLAKGNVHGILLYLARFHKCSLLGDYRCLRVPG